MNYIGSKTKLLNFIQEGIEDFTKVNFENGINFEDLVFCDLFAGTGSVGSYFKKLGCKVLANDTLYFSYIINKNLIENNSLFSQSVLNSYKSLEPYKGFISKSYSPIGKDGRMYFTSENAMKIDAILKELKNADISEGEKAFILSSLIKSADKISNTTSVYGAYLKNFKASSLNEFVLEPDQPVIGKNPGIAYNKKAEDLIKEISGDILFLDPPYNTRRYDTNYHVLETIALNDSPELHGKTGLRPEDSNKKSAFCSKVQSLKTLEEIIKNANFKYIFMTYSTDGIMSPKDIANLFKKYGRFEVKKKLYKRFKADTSSNRTYDKSDLYECLYCLEVNKECS